MSIWDEVKNQVPINNETKYNNEIDYLETSNIINKLNDLETITNSSIDEISKSLDNLSKKFVFKGITKFVNSYRNFITSLSITSEKLKEEITKVNMLEIKTFINSSYEQIKLLKDKHNNNQKVLNFIAKILSLEQETNEVDLELDKFEKLINEKYLKFAEKDDLKNEAEVYDKLISAKDKLYNLIKYKFMINKTVIGVGGGFSAGKSQFINSILKTNTLPVDTRPTTSLPTYIVKGNKDLFEAYTYAGITVNIDKNEFDLMNHRFLENYNISFTRIVNAVVYYSDNFNYDNLVLLDTPGYTKSDYHSKFDNTDEFIAKKQLENTDFLIWVIDIEGGTISLEDIKFIKNLNYNKPIYFVLNKADKKPMSSIKSIIDVTSKTLEDNLIEYEGIIAYSSLQNNIYEVKGKNLLTYLESKNIPTQVDLEDIKSDFLKVFDIYENHFKDKIKKNKNWISSLNQLAVYVDDYSEKYLEDIQATVKKNILESEKLKDELNEIKKDFMNQINKIYNLIGYNNTVIK